MPESFGKFARRTDSTLACLGTPRNAAHRADPAEFRRGLCDSKRLAPRTARRYAPAHGNACALDCADTRSRGSPVRAFESSFRASQRTVRNCVVSTCASRACRRARACRHAHTCADARSGAPFRACRDARASPRPSAASAAPCPFVSEPVAAAAAARSGSKRREFSARVDPFNALLEGRLGLELELELSKYVSLELVPVFVLTKSPPMLNYNTYEKSSLHQESNGWGPLSGAAIDAGLWFGGKPFRGYVLRAWPHQLRLHVQDDSAGQRFRQSHRSSVVRHVRQPQPLGTLHARLWLWARL